MSQEDYQVRPLSWDRVRIEADWVREELGLAKTAYLPVIEMLELVLDQRLGAIEFRVGSLHEMGSAEGLTDPSGRFVELREDVYCKALEGDGRARFTAAHELGHLVLHAGQPLRRSAPTKIISAFESAERQADQFAAEVLMPRTLLHPNQTWQEICNSHGVSRAAAENRLRYMNGKVWRSRRT